MLTSTLAPMGASSLFVVDALIQTTLLLTVVAIAAQLLRKRSASLRHLLWTLGVVGLVAAPLLASAMPFRLHLLPARQIESRRNDKQSGMVRDVSDRADNDVASTSTPSTLPTESDAATPATGDDSRWFSAALSWSSVLIALWALGVLVFLGRFAFGLAVVHRISRRAR